MNAYLAVTTKPVPRTNYFYSPFGNYDVRASWNEGTKIILVAKREQPGVTMPGANLYINDHKRRVVGVIQNQYIEII